MMIDFNAEQPKKTSEAIITSFEPRAKSTASRNSQFLKTEERRTVTEAGMQMERREDRTNAPAAISRSRETESKTTAVKARFARKLSARISIRPGMKIVSVASLIPAAEPGERPSDESMQWPGETFCEDVSR
jgi:hypothetical protein